MKPNVHSWRLIPVDELMVHLNLEGEEIRLPANGGPFPGPQHSYQLIIIYFAYFLRQTNCMLTISVHNDFPN